MGLTGKEELHRATQEPVPRSGLPLTLLLGLEALGGNENEELEGPGVRSGEMGQEPVLLSKDPF